MKKDIVNQQDKGLSQEISFVAKRYQEDKFNVQRAWLQMGLAPVSLWRRFRVGAAITGFVLLTAAAGTALYYNSSLKEPVASESVETTPNPAVVVKVIDFESAPLPTVIERIKEVYGVEVVNVPQDADTYMLSMHFEGNPVELIEAINEILGTEMALKQ